MFESSVSLKCDLHMRDNILARFKADGQRLSTFVFGKEIENV